MRTGTTQPTSSHVLDDSRGALDGYLKTAYEVYPSRAEPPVAPHATTLLIMFDCHAHLSDPSFGEGLDEALVQAEAVGVIGIIAVSESLEDAVKVYRVCVSNILHLNELFLTSSEPLD